MQYWSINHEGQGIGIGVHDRYGLVLGFERERGVIIPVFKFSSWDSFKNFIDSLQQFYCSHAVSDAKLPDCVIKFLEEEMGHAT